MSRKLVIGVCCLNGLLGAGLLWVILGPGVRGRPAVFPPPEQAAEREALSDGEANSLSGTALRADRFLLDRGLAGAGREEALIERAAATLRDGAALVSNRLAAADVLEGLDAAPPPEALRDLFLGTDSERLRLRLLGLLARKEAAPEELAWLDGLEPRTPGQERLIQDILER